MDTILQTNIFFAITAVTVVVVGIFFAVALYYIIEILENIRGITRRAERESELIAEDINDLRMNIREKGLELKHFFGFIGKLAGLSNKKPARHVQKKTEGSVPVEKTKI